MPNRNEGVLLLLSGDGVNCFSLSRSTSAIWRFCNDLLSTSVIDLANAILRIICWSFSPLLLFIDKISAAKQSTYFSSASLREWGDVCVVDCCSVWTVHRTAEEEKRCRLMALLQLDVQNLLRRGGPYLAITFFAIIAR